MDQHLKQQNVIEIKRVSLFDRIIWGVLSVGSAVSIGLVCYYIVKWMGYFRVRSLKSRLTKAAEQYIDRIRLLSISSDRLNVEIVALCLLTVHELTEHWYFKEHYINDLNRIKLLRTFNQNADSYVEQALEMIRIKQGEQDKAWEIIHEIFPFIEENRIYSYIEKINGRDLKEHIRMHYIHTEPLEEAEDATVDSEAFLPYSEWHYYNKTKLCLDQENSAYHISDLYFNKVNTTAKKKTIDSSGKKVYDDRTAQLFVVERVILEDGIRHDLGIRLHHFLYLLTRSAHFKGEIQRKFELIENKDKFIDYY